MDIVSKPIEIDTKKIDSRYRFVVAVAERAQQLNDGAKPMKECRAGKIITLAIQEVLSGSVTVLAGEAAVRAREEVRQACSEALLDEAGKKDTIIEDETTLEKDVRSYLKDKRDSGEERFPWGDLE